MASTPPPPDPLESRWDAARPWRVALAFALGAVLLGVLEAVSLHTYRARFGPPMSWAAALGRTVPSWLVTAALIAPVRLLASRFRLRDDTWARWLPLHLAASGLFAVVAAAGSALLFRALGVLDGEPVQAATVRIFYTYLAYLVLIYWAALGIFHAFDYHRESVRRERERAALAVHLTQARLSALRAQLNPHFFFNTLNAISTFSLQGKPEEVQAMVASLGELVRACVDDRLPHEVPLERELELIDSYLDIQRVRFADWLRVGRDVAPGLERLLVPPLILQPLVENAIEHGLGASAGAGEVRIRCAREDGMLLLEVVDTGPGAATGGRPAARTQVGLGNTRARLEHLYPGRHAFHAGPAPGGGWRAAVTLPARMAPEPARPA